MPVMENGDFKIGIATFICYHQPLLPILPLFSKTGFKNLELWGVSFYGSPLHFPYKDKNYLKKFAQALKEFSLTPYSLHASFHHEWSISSKDEEKRKKAVKEIEESIEVAQFLNIQLIVVHPGSSTGESSWESFWRSIEELWFFSSSLGIQIALENMIPGIFGYDLESISHMKEKLPPSIGFCLDTGHAFISGALSQMVEVMDGKLFHLHLQDTCNGEDAHLLPGEGCINWEKFRKDMEKIGYQGVWMLEVRERKDRGLEELLLSAREAIEKLRTV